MKARHDRVIRGFVLLLIVILGGMIWVNRDRFVPIGPGARAPEYHMTTLAGDSVKISDYRGKVLVLNVWATWCEPCVREMPQLQALHENLASEGVEVVGVSVDYGADKPVLEFVDRFDLTFPILRDPSGDIQTAYAIGGLPTTFVIDRDGRIRQREVGAREWADSSVVAALRRLLAD
jgi:peroxiredoxin